MELARRLGVSQTAVSAALRGRERQLRLDPTLAARIRREAARLGYRPNVLARSLLRRRTDTLGVVVSDFGDPTFGILLNHLESAALGAGQELIVTGCGASAAETGAMWERLLRRRVDGVLWIDRPPHLGAAGLARLWATASVPVVGIGTAFRAAGAPAVVFDSEDAVRQLVAAMPRGGRSPYVFLQENPSAEFSRWRLECLRRLLGHGGTGRPRCVAAHVAAGVDAGRLGRLRAAGEPLRLIGDQDFTGLRALVAVEAAGWRDGRDFVLGSFDGLPWLRNLGSVFLSVEQPLEEMARRAIAMALSPPAARRVEMLRGRLLDGR
jgi:DNA-binding LacI/PurR family transcriptional regulator